MFGIFKGKIMKKIKAWTMAELGVALLCLSVLATVTIVVVQPRKVALRAYYEATFKNLKSINNVIVSNNDGSLPAENYCETIRDTSNIGGTINCTSSSVPTGGSDKKGTPNFTLPNQAMYYGFEKKFSTSTDSDKFGKKIKVWVNVDGTRGRNVSNDDVLPFWIYQSGKILPIEADANTANLLRASIVVYDKNVSVKTPKEIIPDLSYMEANCKANSDEYLSSDCTSKGYSVISQCNRHDYICTVKTAELSPHKVLFPIKPFL